MKPKGSLSDNSFWLLISLDTCIRKISNIRLKSLFYIFPAECHQLFESSLIKHLS